MARRRLRHKLMRGLALVAGSILLLAAGTCYGIYSYYLSVKTTDKKIVELTIATQILETLASLEQLKENDKDAYLDRVERTRSSLGYFRELNAKTVASGYDPDGGEEEAALIVRLDAELVLLTGAVREAAKPGEVGKSTPLGDKPVMREAHEKARRTAEHLRLALIHDIQKGGRKSSAAIKTTLGWVGFIVLWALALVFMLLYDFRVWLFAPIRELQAGVARVHGGNFNQPIVLTSGDELQELADEFNTMVARLHAMYADLARQVNERSRQLVRSERMVSVGFLAAGVAHEINNPLASILFCSEALERRLHDTLAALVGTASGPVAAEAEVLVRYLKMIHQETLRCKDITQKLLDFSRTGDRRKDPTDLTGLVKGVLEVAKHLPSSRGKMVTFEPTAYVVAPVNAQDLKSVILNLVVNALDSMDDGGRLAITLTTTAGYAEMVFADTGCGMAPDVLQNIFEPFYTKSRTGKGTGLGLFISHQIVDQHGGTITANSSGPGTGSTFTVRIPLELSQGDTAGQGQDPDPEPTVLSFPGRNAA